LVSHLSRCYLGPVVIQINARITLASVFAPLLAACAQPASADSLGRQLDLTLCPAGARDNCVHDGDTFWLAGEKIRILDIDTPELNGQCASEQLLAIRARDRLLELLNAGPFELVEQGRHRDRNGRLLRIVVRHGRSIGDRLVAEGLARTWSGRREPWC
jgi:endonuclease YncB( thermonuclease family)